MRDRLRLRGREDDGGAGALADEAAEQDARNRREQESLELRERIAAQWAEVRAARRAMETRPEVAAGTSNDDIKYARDLAPQFDEDDI